jgi:hypothetical protein
MRVTDALRPVPLGSVVSTRTGSEMLERAIESNHSVPGTPGSLISLETAEIAKKSLHIYGKNLVTVV